METVVKPKRVRLLLSDVAKRALADLLATKKATPDQIADAEDRVAFAVEEAHWIVVKRRLNVGEQHDTFKAMAPTLIAGEGAKLDTGAVMTAKIVAYLIGWSLMDEGEPIPMSEHMPPADRLAALRSLDPEVFADIRDAIDWHERVVEQEIAASKKMRGGAANSSNTSTSPDGLVTAGQTGSVN